MITERTLRRWRKDALIKYASMFSHYGLSDSAENVSTVFRAYEECQQRILRLTQELMDLHLMKKG